MTDIQMYVATLLSHFLEQELDRELNDLNRVIKNAQKGIVIFFVRVHTLITCMCTIHCAYC